MGVHLTIILAIATVLGGLSALYYFYGEGKKWWRDRQIAKKIRLLEQTGPSIPGNASATVEALVSYLKNDQEESGIHRGQFGRGQRLAEESRYQTGKEAPDTKPRLYLTGWPVFILMKHRRRIEGRAMLSAAESGVQRLLTDGWVHVSMGAHRYTSPVSPAGPRRVISIDTRSELQKYCWRSITQALRGRPS